MSNPGPGHNSSTADKGISAQRLKSFIERAERLEVDKENISADMKEMYSEAKSCGYDPRIMKKVVKLRKMDPNDRQEEDALLQTYIDAVGF